MKRYIWIILITLSAVTFKPATVFCDASAIWNCELKVADDGYDPCLVGKFNDDLFKKNDYYDSCKDINIIIEKIKIDSKTCKLGDSHMLLFQTNDVVPSHKNDSSTPEDLMAQHSGFNGGEITIKDPVEINNPAGITIAGYNVFSPDSCIGDPEGDGPCKKESNSGILEEGECYTDGHNGERVCDDTYQDNMDDLLYYDVPSQVNDIDSYGEYLYGTACGEWWGNFNADDKDVIDAFEEYCLETFTHPSNWLKSKRVTIFAGYRWGTEHKPLMQHEDAPNGSYSRITIDIPDNKAGLTVKNKLVLRDIELVIKSGHILVEDGGELILQNVTIKFDFSGIKDIKNAPRYAIKVANSGRLVIDDETSRFVAPKKDVILPEGFGYISLNPAQQLWYAYAKGENKFKGIETYWWSQLNFATFPKTEYFNPIAADNDGVCAVNEKNATKCNPQSLLEEYDCTFIDPLEPSNNTLGYTLGYWVSPKQKHMKKYLLNPAPTGYKIAFDLVSVYRRGYFICGDDKTYSVTVKHDCGDSKYPVSGEDGKVKCQETRGYDWKYDESHDAYLCDVENGSNLSSDGITCFPESGCPYGSVEENDGDGKFKGCACPEGKEQFADDKGNFICIQTCSLEHGKNDIQNHLGEKDQIIKSGYLDSEGNKNRNVTLSPENLDQCICNAPYEMENGKCVDVAKETADCEGKGDGWQYDKDAGGCDCKKDGFIETSAGKCEVSIQDDCGTKGDLYDYDGDTNTCSCKYTGANADASCACPSGTKASYDYGDMTFKCLSDSGGEDKDECKADSDCGKDELCDSGKCVTNGGVAKSFGDACSSDDDQCDTANGLACFEGKCYCAEGWMINQATMNSCISVGAVNPEIACIDEGGEYIESKCITNPDEAACLKQENKIWKDGACADEIALENGAGGDGCSITTNASLPQSITSILPYLALLASVRIIRRKSYFI